MILVLVTFPFLLFIPLFHISLTIKVAGPWNIGMLVEPETSLHLKFTTQISLLDPETSR